MANYNQNNDKYTEDIRKVEPTDPAHADLINELAQAIINNIAFNKRCINEHINSDNPHEIDADTGRDALTGKIRNFGRCSQV